MSYDVSLYTPSPKCPTCGRQDEREEHFRENMTSNVAPMWRHAGINLHDYAYRDDEHAAKAKDIIPELEAGLERLRADPATYEAMNPSNGWGDYSSAVRYISHILAACREYPEALVYVSN